ncbi:MAG TPA: WG repeat-containing protein [Pyrinomonadaceae bacterium]|nr:WG repeat-containing protein [Pyrinomonadaceae bacterium]
MWDERGKYGFIDAGGRVVIKPHFDAALPFTEGLAAVSLDKKWGFIDSSGRVVVPLGYYGASPFSDGVAAVYIKDGESRPCGYIDHSGQFVIKPQNKFTCTAFNEGFAQIDVYSDQWHETFDGYVNKRGEQALGGPFVRADAFSEGLALVVPYETSVFINSQAETVINLKGYAGNDTLADEYEPVGSFSEGLAEVGIKSTFRAGYYRYGYVNKEGRVVFKLPESIRRVSAFRQGRALVFQEKTEKVRVEMGDGEVITMNADVSSYGYIDKTGRLVIPARFSDAEDFSDGLAAVKTGKPQPSNRRDLKGSAAESYFKDDEGSWNCINLAGSIVIKRCGEPLPDKELTERFPKFGASFGRGFTGGLFFSKTYVGGNRPGEERRAVYGYMNRSGRYVWIQPYGKNVTPPVWWLDNYR